MAIINRLHLENSILAWLRRASLRTPVVAYDAIKTLITLAEEDMNNRLRVREMIVRGRQPAAAGYMSLPTDYLEAHDVRLENGPALLYWTRDDAANQLASDVRTSAPAMITDRRGRYAVTGNQMEIFFPPGEPITDAMIELSYYRRLALPDLPIACNAVLDRHFSCYLFGSLAMSAPLLNDNEKLKTWAELYTNGVTAANDAAKTARHAGSPLVQRFRRIG